MLNYKLIMFISQIPAIAAEITNGLDREEEDTGWLSACVSVCVSVECRIQLLGIDCLHSHTHTLINTLHHACCYDEIKGIQDLKIYSHARSHARSLILSICVCVLSSL